MTGIVKAVCTSEKKGTAKKNVGKAVFLENHGLVGDAHAGTWHRQVSLLSWEKIEAFKALGGKYLFSRIELSNAKEAGFILEGTFTHEKSPYTLYLYRVS